MEATTTLIDHFKRYKPSLSDLTYDQQRAIHINIRGSRLMRKVSPTRSAGISADQRRNKRLNDLIGSMSAEDLAVAERALEQKKAKLGS